MEEASKTTTEMAKKHNQKEWLVMYDRLKKFKETTGHCNVKKRYTCDRKLGHWVHYQRTLWKKSSLLENRINMLESIGFVWIERASATSPSGGKCSWDIRYIGATL